MVVLSHWLIGPSFIVHVGQVVAGVGGGWGGGGGCGDCYVLTMRA